MGYSSFSVWGGSVVVGLRDVEGVPGAGRSGRVAPAFADTALSWTWVTWVVLKGEVGVLVGVVLVESEAAAKPWTSSLVRGVVRVISLLKKSENW